MEREREWSGGGREMETGEKHNNKSALWSNVYT